VPAVALLVALVPPLQSPDETIHVCRAAQLSRGALLSIVDARGRAGNYVDVGLWWLTPVFLDILNGQRGTMSWARFERARQLRWTGTLTFCEMPGLSYGPIAYAPQALGLLVGRVLGLSVLTSYYMARLFAATVGLALGNLALRMMPCGRLLAFIVLVLPMTLFQLASMSQDAFQIPAAVLVIALGTRLIARGDENSAKSPWSLVALAAVVAAGRPPLVPLAFLAATPPPPGDAGERRGAWRNRVLAVAACLVVLVVWFSAVAPRYQETRRGSVVDPARQVAFLRENPGHLASIVTTSFVVSGRRWAEQTVGVIGWLDARLPSWLYHVAWGLLAAAVLIDPFRRVRVDVMTRGLHLVVFGVSFLGVLWATYLAWSDVGAARIRGVQGRYFLPLIPLLGVGLGIGIDRPWLRTCATAVAAVFALSSAIATLVTVVERYYP
jgi:hypothetical protein